MKKQPRTSKSKALSAVSLDAMHDTGVDLSSLMDQSKATRPGRAIKVRLADALAKTAS